MLRVLPYLITLGIICASNTWAVDIGPVLEKIELSSTLKHLQANVLQVDGASPDFEELYLSQIEFELQQSYQQFIYHWPWGPLNAEKLIQEAKDLGDMALKSAPFKKAIGHYLLAGILQSYATRPPEFREGQFFQAFNVFFHRGVPQIGFEEKSFQVAAGSQDTAGLVVLGFYYGHRGETKKMETVWNLAARKGNAIGLRELGLDLRIRFRKRYDFNIFAKSRDYLNRACFRMADASSCNELGHLYSEIRYFSSLGHFSLSSPDKKRFQKLALEAYLEGARLGSEFAKIQLEQKFGEALWRDERIGNELHSKILKILGRKPKSRCERLGDNLAYYVEQFGSSFGLCEPRNEEE